MVRHNASSFNEQHVGTEMARASFHYVTSRGWRSRAFSVLRKHQTSSVINELERQELCSEQRETPSRKASECLNDLNKIPVLADEHATPGLVAVFSVVFLLLNVYPICLKCRRATTT
jgi:hypothetical protein